MRLARIKDRDTFYSHRDDLHRLGYITHHARPGEPATTGSQNE